MGISMPVVWSDSHRLHEPDGEIYVGVRTPGSELPERVERIRRALESAGAPLILATGHPDGEALSLHDPAMVGYLRTAWSDWQARGLAEDPGQDRVVPYLFPHPGLVGSHAFEPAADTAARAGTFCFDTMTLIGPGTWEAARAAVDVALTAADLVIEGKRSAYALCRPPGHHSTREAFGGSTYLNNAAAAAARLRDALGGPVALLDIDAHHGNGAQSIFWEDGSVLSGSVHVDPAAGWFPHFLGFAGETGAGAGANLNLPLAPGSGDDKWLAAIEDLAAWTRERGAAALVVALGVDAAGDDPEAPLNVSVAGFETAGRLLAGLGLPTVFVQEGGYDLESIGELVAATLSGFELGRAPLRG
jgi:acetoin utilization deacetylase AcuC-like enzyme